VKKSGCTAELSLRRLSFQILFYSLLEVRAENKRRTLSLLQDDFGRFSGLPEQARQESA
jgi:hypothetical protein